MPSYATSFGIGFVAGMRSVTACAALTRAASQDRTRVGVVLGGPVTRILSTSAAMAEMVGDKMPFAPDRRIPPSFALRIAIGAVGGWARAGRSALLEYRSLAGVAGAIAGTLIGRAARRPDSITAHKRGKRFVEDAATAGSRCLSSHPPRVTTRSNAKDKFLGAAMFEAARNAIAGANGCLDAVNRTRGQARRLHMAGTKGQRSDRLNGPG